MNINDALISLLNTLLVALLAFAGKEAIVLTPKIKDFIELKVGEKGYNELMQFGIDAWNKIEEDNRLGDLLFSKSKAFEQLMIKKFPEITQDEINFINKAIAGELNKDKVDIAQTITHAAPQEATTAPQVRVEATAPPTPAEAVTQAVELTPAASAAPGNMIINGIEYAPLQVVQG